MKTKALYLLLALLSATQASQARQPDSLACQRMLTLDSCRTLALANNKQLNAAKLRQDVALNTRKALRTKYLPKVDAIAGYDHFSKEVSILNNRQKTSLSNLGTNAVTNAGQSLTAGLTNLVGQGLLSPEAAQLIGGAFNNVAPSMAEAGDNIGQTIRDAFRTDTRNIWAGAITLRQPLYMGGAITAANRIADINELIVSDNIDQKTQSTLYDIDQTYWLVVSLHQKQKLAGSYLELVRKLNDDVHKMIAEGVATRADGLKVDVKVNEAEMALTQADNGLALSRMLLCQLCGLPMSEPIVLADEEGELSADDVAVSEYTITDPSLNTRPELRMLENAIDISKETKKLIRAEYMPHVALTGGYLISNPNVFNGFERRFSGVWNIGVLVQVPVWNWFEGSYKIRATLELNDAREKITLQISQSQFKLKEAQKKLAMTQKNIQSAEENLRCANVGFREGVMESTDVMAAQTAWQLAHTQYIDAAIEVRLAQVNLRKALGILR